MTGRERLELWLQGTSADPAHVVPPVLTFVPPQRDRVTAPDDLAG